MPAATAPPPPSPHPLRENARGDWSFVAHDGQERALKSGKRFPVVLAGTQGGKTVLGPPWLYSEILSRGAGDYLIATPTYPLLEVKALPEFKRLFAGAMQLGRYVASPLRKFTFRDDVAEALFGTAEVPTQIFFGHAGDPESLEAATYKAAWLDEAGQKAFRPGSWDAVLRRLSIHQGRCLITTTPYQLGWLKTRLYDPWVRAGRDHPEIDVINFRSVDNPAFPRAEWERAKRDLPGWKFRMFYCGLFERPAGLVYDCFEEARHVVPRFAVPEDWPRWVGLDFGPVNTAAVFFAEERGGTDGKPTGRLFAYREYHHGSRSSAEHVAALKRGEARLPVAVGGAPRTEQGWRDAFRAAGLPVREPAVDKVEPGVDAVYAAFRNDQLYFFDDLEETLGELNGYAYELDDLGEPTDKLDDPHSFHLCDAIRYIIGYLKRGRSRFTFFA